jgi:hypothetical protein
MFFQRRTVQADFEREVMPHLQALYGVALRMTKSEGDAEDLVQDAICAPTVSGTASRLGRIAGPGSCAS